MRTLILSILLVGLWLRFPPLCVAAEPTEAKPIELRAYGVPDTAGADPDSLATLAVLDAFQKRYPDIRPVSTSSLQFANGTITQDVVPLMQIAGDIAPDVLQVNFRRSDTYIRQKFLYPMDRYLEQAVGLEIPSGELLHNDEYVARLQSAPRYAEEIAPRVPLRAWAIMRRRCPYGANCPYLKAWDRAPAAEHYHTWCFPQNFLVMALFYRRDLFSEAGLPDRVPANLDEFYDWAKKLTNPKEDRYGVSLFMDAFGWGSLSFLYSEGGRVVRQREDGTWVCCFNDQASVNAYYNVARLFHAPFQNQWGRFDNVVYTGDTTAPIKFAMQFNYVGERFFQGYDPAQWGFGPVPAGPDGRRGAEFNADMTGIYAGLGDNVRVRDAAWEFIRFFNGPEARKIRARVFVDNGFGQYMSRDLLEAAGYPEYVRQIPRGWEEAKRIAMESGIPEPYGQNCSQVYRYLGQAVDQIRTDSIVTDAIVAGDEGRAKARIKEILDQRVTHSNEQMLDILTPGQRAFRRNVAGVVAVVILVVFVLVFRSVIRAFAAPDDTLKRQTAKPRLDATASLRGFAPEESAQPPKNPGFLQLSKYKWAYLMLLPAVGSIALWAYYPLARGTTMAFQDYNVRGFSQWVGLDNFANVLFDDDFWFSLWVTVKYGLLFIAFGFGAPIVLALLLTEVPRGKLLFRTLFYLPAVLSGVVVIFLWRGFYGPYGMINQLLNGIIALLNHLPHTAISPVETDWLASPGMALFFCLLPIIWAGMGPGCLIYLAALKTIPEDIYEAADIDGAGIRRKLWNITLPSIRPLIAINFIGVMIGMLKGGGEFILAMTGGGPYTPYGQTEVVGLHIFWQAFGYLRFGAATAMAWVLGSMLIGFTMLQLKKLSRMEFRSADSPNAT